MLNSLNYYCFTNLFNNCSMRPPNKSERKHELDIIMSVSSDKLLSLLVLRYKSNVVCWLRHLH